MVNDVAMISGMVVMVAGVIVVRVTIWGFIVLLVVLLVNPTMIVDIVFYCLDVRIDLYYILVYICVYSVLSYYGLQWISLLASCLVG